MFVLLSKQRENVITTQFLNTKNIYKMKKIVLTILASSSLGLFAQTNDTTIVEETVIRIGNVKVIINKDDDTTKIIKVEKKYPNLIFKPSFDLGVTGYNKVTDQGNNITVINPDQASYELDYSRCRNFTINGNVAINITKNFGVLTGFNFDFNNYSFKENLTVQEGTGFYQLDTLITYDKYKLKAAYLQLPLMLKFQSSNEDFQFAVGGTIGYKLRSWTKFRHSYQGVRVKGKVKDHYDLNPLKASLGARFNYKGIGLFFNYGLTSLFENTKADLGEYYNLMPFSVGITFGSF